MVEAIVYCDRCGRIILPSDLGKAVHVDSEYVCARCVEALDDDQREELFSRSDSSGHAHTHGDSAKTGSRRLPSRRTATPRLGHPSAVLAAAIAAGTLAGIAAVLVLAKKSPTDGTSANVSAAEHMYRANPEVVMAVPAVSTDALSSPSVAPGRVSTELGDAPGTPLNAIADAAQDSDADEDGKPNPARADSAVLDSPPSKVTERAAQQTEEPKTAAAVAPAAPAAPAAPPKGIPEDGRALNGKWYKLYAQQLSWHDARRFCEELGGHMITISSAEEDSFALDLAEKAGASVWIGMSDERQEGKWEWVTGEAVEYSGWGPGEPSNGSNYEHFGAIERTRVWNDVRGSQGDTRAFVCEWEPEVIALGLAGGSAQDVVARPDKDGYRLSPAIVAALADRLRQTDAVPRKLAAMGGSAAANSSFDRYLKSELAESDGYAFASKTGLSGSGMSVRAALKKAEARLKAEKPEIVRICFGLADLAQGRSPADIQPDLAQAVDSVLACGSVPVLYTLPVLKPTSETSAKLIDTYNEMLADLASDKNVPYVDAFSILNKDPSLCRKYFSHKGRLSGEGHDALNERFLKLYRVLETSLLRRQEESPQLAASDNTADATAPEATAPAAVAENSPEQNAAPARKPGTATTRPAAKVAERRPQDNLVMNGGFEEINSTTRFASRWSFTRWGAKGAGSYGRIDRSNPHSGDQALQVRGLGDGAKPGAFTTLKLEPGRYELRFWACADVGETAKIQAHLAGKDLAEMSATEEWQMFRSFVVVDAVAKKKRMPDSSLRLWISTPRVRVWFDDIALFKAQEGAGDEAVGAVARDVEPSETAGPGETTTPESVSADATPDWVDVSDSLSGVAGGDSSVWMLTTVPKRDKVIACMVGRGLFSSADNGATWKEMGKPDNRPAAGNSCRFEFDPRNPDAFWVSGMYKFAIWRTDNGGATFTRLGGLDHLDGLSVDFSDPARKTLLTGLHEQTRSLHRSTDGGKSWSKIGDRLPADSSFSSDPIIIDSNTYIVNTAGWAQGKTWGIYRSTDAGNNWSKVSEFGAAGVPLIATDGTIYWQVLWDMFIIKSSDQGRTWTRMQGPVRGSTIHSLIELPGGRLVGLGDRKMYASVDKGVSWSPFGPSTPFKPAGLVYNAARRTFFTWRHSKGRIPNAAMRYTMPQDPDLAFSDVKAGSMKVWNGDDFAGGAGWVNPGDPTFLKVQTNESHDGRAALQLHIESPSQMSGWNWHSWGLNNLTDISDFKNLAFWVKVVGRATSIKVTLSCGPHKHATGEVSVEDFCKGMHDGKWHEAVIPLSALYANRGQFDPKTTYELRVMTESAQGEKLDVYIDDIRFDNRSTASPRR